MGGGRVLEGRKHSTLKSTIKIYWRALVTQYRETLLSALLPQACDPYQHPKEVKVTHIYMINLVTCMREWIRKSADTVLK